MNVLERELEEAHEECRVLLNEVLRTKRKIDRICQSWIEPVSDRSADQHETLSLTPLRDPQHIIDSLTNTHKFKLKGTDQLRSIWDATISETRMEFSAMLHASTSRSASITTSDCSETLQSKHRHLSRRAIIPSLTHRNY